MLAFGLLFGELRQMSEAAVQLVGKAKNRMNKFYNSKVYHAFGGSDRYFPSKPSAVMQNQEPP